MDDLKYSFLGDGPTDKRLMAPVSWLLREYLPDYGIQAQWADLSRLPRKPEGLTERMLKSIELYPCDILFVHRDVERESVETRKTEITRAAEGISVPVICVVPKRMQEAWMLFDEPAIRKAACNPNGRKHLDMPSLAKCEDLPNPKEMLYNLLLEASDLPSHRRKNVPVERYAYRVTEKIEDYSPLRRLSSFSELENDIQVLIQRHKWNQPEAAQES